MQMILLNLILAGLAACLTHEGGHYVSARAFGRRLKFRFAWGLLFGAVPIPRGVWTMPWMERWKQKVVAVSGFGMEFICALDAAALGWPWLLVVAACHFAAYPFYAGNASDFKWL